MEYFIGCYFVIGEVMGLVGSYWLVIVLLFGVYCVVDGLFIIVVGNDKLFWLLCDVFGVLVFVVDLCFVGGEVCKDYEVEFECMFNGLLVVYGVVVWCEWFVCVGLLVGLINWVD